MKNKFILLLSLLLVLLDAQAKFVDPETARMIGERFLSRNISLPRGLPELRLVYTFQSKASFSPSARPTPYIYVFNADTVAFVMVAADDAVEPILGYSGEDHFRAGNLPINVRKYFEGYRAEIRYVIENHIEATGEIKAKWESLKSGIYDGPEQAGQTIVVNPLLTTKWNQSPFYNDLCPLDRDVNKRAVTGCVATAMAQIMKFWNYPAKGNDFRSYNHNKFGTLSANFGGTTYNWSGMPNNVTSTNNAVATLMYHCGVSVDMTYGVNSSGAQPNKIANAFKKYFGYAGTTRFVERSQGTDAQWIDLIKNELNAGRPVNYNGYGNGGGHAFVCDGYDANNKFHMNWGWGGAYDGYFTINALNPEGLGTGGGTGGYNNNQNAVIGIAPATPPAQSISMTLYSALQLSADTVPYGNAFTVTTNFANYGTGTFTGDYCIALFDDAYDFVDFVEIKTGYTLASNQRYTNNLVFSFAANFSLLPGNYYVSAYYKPTNGAWKSMAGTAQLSNFRPLRISNNNSIQLNSDIVMAPATLIKGQAGSVTFNIVNRGSTAFVGQYNAGIYDLKGNSAQNMGTINENNGLQPNYTYTSPFLKLSVPGVNLEPGTYLVAIQHKASSATTWQLTGTGNFLNPTKVIVKAPPLVSDVYEPNQNVGQSYQFTPSFVSDSAKLASEGSSLHFEEDFDFYKINLPSGYNYSITARIHDSYDAGNGKSYTADALFSYSTDGTTWSDVFDDVMPAPINVAGGKTLYLFLAPFAAGETGTYLMDIRIKRTVVTGVNDPESKKLVKVFPNPISDRVNINIDGQYAVREWHDESVDAAGRRINTGPLTAKRNTIATDKLPRGHYIVSIYRNGLLVRTEQLVKP